MPMAIMARFLQTIAAFGRGLPESSRPQARRRRGFTLLEVLLSIALSAALLAALWSAVDIHLRAFDAGSEQTQRSALARALLHKLETDLCRLLPESRPGQPQATEFAEPPLPPASAPGDTTATGAGEAFIHDQAASLIGNSRQLRLRVCQPGSGLEQPLIATDFVAPAMRVPDDLRTVYYWLARPAGMEFTADAGQVPRGAGLVRREGPWLRFTEATFSRQPGEVAQPGMPGGDEQLMTFVRGELPPDDQPYQDDSLIIAGEVTGFRLRYFDGKLWHDAWNSRQQGCLPAAVEVCLFLEPEEPVDVAIDSHQSNRPLLPDYRLVVPLTAGEKLEPGSQAPPFDSDGQSAWPTELPP
jgi:prepilin-type N-terminal cleavage/methylation domain-containing protein